MSTQKPLRIEKEISRKTEPGSDRRKPKIPNKMSNLVVFCTKSKILRGRKDSKKMLALAILLQRVLLTAI